MGTAIYARQSVDRRGEAAAVQRQIDECRTLAAEDGIVVDIEIVDNDISATSGVKRPGFEKLMGLVRARSIDTILVWHPDRLYRQLKDLVTIVDAAREGELRVLAVKAGDLDLSSPAGRMVAGLLGSVASYETEQKAARQIAANIQRAKEGRWQFSNRPFGYDRLDGRVVIVEKEAEVIRAAYARYISGESYYAIVQDLNSRGVPAMRGGSWTMTQLRDRLRNPAYAGLRAYKGQVVARGDWPPLVDAETWERYQEARQHRGTRHNWPNRTKYLLSGLAVCGVCGARMLARPHYQGKKTDPGRRVTMSYQCTSKWCVSRSLEHVDEVVESAVLSRLTKTDAASMFEAAPSVAPLAREAQALRQRRDELAKLFADGTLTSTAVREQSARILLRLDELQRQIAAIESGSATENLLLAEDIEQEWRTALTLREKRAIISTLVRVTVHKQASRVFDPSTVEVDWLLD